MHQTHPDVPAANKLLKHQQCRSSSSTAPPLYLHNYSQLHQMIGDFSCCWGSMDQIPFTRHLQDVCRQNENLVEAHRCHQVQQIQESQKNVFPINVFESGNQPICTCPQHDKKCNTSKGLNISNAAVSGNVSSIGHCPTCGSEPVYCQNFFSARPTEASHPTTHPVVGGHTGPASLPPRAVYTESAHSRQTLNDQACNTNCSNQFNATQETHNDVVGSEETLQTSLHNESSTRPRGKKLLCPKNATPLYGKVPSWWGDSPPDMPSSPLDPPRTEPSRVKVHSKPNTGGQTDESGQSTDKSPTTEKRGQSTAFVINIGNADQSQMSLSASLPSFQINDHLCSYFPTSRKMSLLKREAAVRRKHSIETNENSENGDSASENGTYVVDLDMDDIDNEYDESAEIRQENVYKHVSNREELPQSNDNDKRESKANFFGKDGQSTRAENTGECKDSDATQKRNSLRNNRRLSRKKSFVICSDKVGKQVASQEQLWEEIEENNSTLNNLSLDSQINSEEIELSDVSFLDHESSPRSSTFVNNSIDTRQLSKESSTNLEHFGSFESDTDDITILKVDSPKILKKEAKSNKNSIKMDEIFEDERHMMFSKPTSTTRVTDFNENFLKNDGVEYGTRAFFDEFESCMSTTRSMKTDLLLKPTEEITDHLKNSKKTRNYFENEFIPESNNNNNKEENLSNVSLASFETNNISEQSVPETFKKKIHSDPPNFFLHNDENIRTDSFEGFQSSPHNFEVEDDLDSIVQEFKSDVRVSQERKRNKQNTQQSTCRLSLPPQIEESDEIEECSRPESVYSYRTDSRLESERSGFTGVSLGQEIVHRSRNISSASTRKPAKSFVPPHRKNLDSSLQRIISLGSMTLDNESKAPSRYGSAKTGRIQENSLKPKVKRNSLVGDQSLVELSVKGNSLSKISLVSSGRSEYLQRNISTRKRETSDKKMKDDISCLTSIMKYSAQIQLLSGNLLELISLRNEQIKTHEPKNSHQVHLTVSSRLNLLSNTMKGTTDQIFDLHDFLIAEMDQS